MLLFFLWPPFNNSRGGRVFFKFIVDWRSNKRISFMKTVWFSWLRWRNAIWEASIGGQDSVRMSSMREKGSSFPSFVSYLLQLLKKTCSRILGWYFFEIFDFFSIQRCYCFKQIWHFHRWKISTSITTCKVVITFVEPTN